MFSFALGTGRGDGMESSMIFWGMVIHSVVLDSKFTSNIVQFTTRLLSNTACKYIGIFETFRDIDNIKSSHKISLVYYRHIRLKPCTVNVFFKGVSSLTTTVACTSGSCLK